MARSTSSRSSDAAAGCFGLSGCGCVVLVVIFNLLLGAFSVNYCTESILGKHIDTIFAVIAGLFLAEITVPLMVICWVLRLCGIEAPFVH